MEILIAPLTVSKTFKEQELMKESHSRWRKLAVFQLLRYHIVFVCVVVLPLPDCVQTLSRIFSVTVFWHCVLVFCSVLASVHLRKLICAPPCLVEVSKCCLWNSFDVCLIENDSFSCPSKEDWVLPFSTPLSPVVNGVMSLSLCSDFV